MKGSSMERVMGVTGKPPCFTEMSGERPKRRCARLSSLCACGVQAYRRARNDSLSLNRRNWQSCSTSFVPVVVLEVEAPRCFGCYQKRASEQDQTDQSRHCALVVTAVPMQKLGAGLL